MKDKRITTIIVDDEKGALDAMESIVLSYPERLKLVTKANSVETAIDAITTEKPELVFLDIRIHDQTGFDVLSSVVEHDFEVVFVTAYGEYALDAFNSRALSYLLKPVSFEAFEKVLERCEQIILAKRHMLNKKNSDPQKTQNKFLIPEGTSITYVEANTIIMAKADGSYCDLHLIDGERKTISKPLKFIENQPASDGFLRVHRSFLINTNHIVKWHKTQKNKVTLSLDLDVPVSKEGKKSLKAFYTS